MGKNIEILVITWTIVSSTLLSASNESSAQDFTGKLTFLEMHRDGFNGVNGLDGAGSVIVSPDGAHVYVTGAIDNAVSVFERLSSTGRLSFLEFKQDGLNGVDGLEGAIAGTISPDGKHLYILGFDDNAIAVFRRNTSTGILTYVENKKNGVGGVDGIGGASGTTVSPDGEHVYVAGFIDNAIAVFRRDTSTGALTFVEKKQDGGGGVDGLGGSFSVAISPDGEHIYATGFSENAVAVFKRNVFSGTLSFIEKQQNGTGGLDGLNGAASAAVSPDGENVYITGANDNALVVFGRNSTTGALTYIERKKDGTSDVDGLNGISAVTVSPDGLNVYATADADNAIAVFSRNTTTGSLSFMEIKRDGVDGVDGLNSASVVTVSPDGANVYVAGFNDNAVAVFARTGVDSINTAIAGRESHTTVDDFALKQNYPNPFNFSTTITYQVPTQSNVIIKVYSVSGREVRTLVNRYGAPGQYTIKWDATDRDGRTVNSGVYFYSLQAGKFGEVRKLILLK